MPRIAKVRLKLVSFAPPAADRRDVVDECAQRTEPYHQLGDSRGLLGLRLHQLEHRRLQLARVGEPAGGEADEHRDESHVHEQGDAVARVPHLGDAPKAPPRPPEAARVAEREHGRKKVRVVIVGHRRQLLHLHDVVRLPADDGARRQPVGQEAAEKDLQRDARHVGGRRDAHARAGEVARPVVVEDLLAMLVRDEALARELIARRRVHHGARPHRPAALARDHGEQLHSVRRVGHRVEDAHGPLLVGPRLLHPPVLLHRVRLEQRAPLAVAACHQRRAQRLLCLLEEWPREHGAPIEDGPHHQVDPLGREGLVAVLRLLARGEAFVPHSARAVVRHHTLPREHVVPRELELLGQLVDPRLALRPHAQSAALAHPHAIGA
mmetsp:Transcript_17670/g.42349  ORF Transcript_17670/g.42349 Transcript_17670/m.42349 type:complete len:380 (-) Transcript_17670:1722-2861(-)